MSIDRAVSEEFETYLQDTINYKKSYRKSKGVLSWLGMGMTTLYLNLAGANMALAKPPEQPYNPAPQVQREDEVDVGHGNNEGIEDPHHHDGHGHGEEINDDGHGHRQGNENKTLPTGPGGAQVVDAHLTPSGLVIHDTGYFELGTEVESKEVELRGIGNVYFQPKLDFLDNPLVLDLGIEFFTGASKEVDAVGGADIRFDGGYNILSLEDGIIAIGPRFAVFGQATKSGEQFTREFGARAGGSVIVYEPFGAPVQLRFGAEVPLYGSTTVDGDLDFDSDRVSGYNLAGLVVVDPFRESPYVPLLTIEGRYVDATVEGEASSGAVMADLESESTQLDVLAKIFYQIGDVTLGAGVGYSKSTLTINGFNEDPVESVVFVGEVGFPVPNFGPTFENWVTLGIQYRSIKGDNDEMQLFGGVVFHY